MITTQRKTILIVGDWVVDEYWFLVRHHSDISSHTGFIHFRMLSNENDIVKDLCGAGHVARLLYHMKDIDVGHSYKLLGLGLWNGLDTEFIAHLIHSRIQDIDCPAAKVTNHLVPQHCQTSPDIQLVTLEPNYSTIRVIRSYHEGKAGVEQINRVDWEAERKPSPNLTTLMNALPKPKEVTSIVVYDLNKGAVTPDLVKQLKKRYPGAGWYVKSKELSPRWLDLIKGCLNLMVIGPEVAAIRNPWDRWMVNGKVTKQAIEIMDCHQAANTVLLSDHCEVITHVDSTDECFTTRSSINPTPLTQLGWSSAYFAALIYRLFIKNDQPSIKLSNEDLAFAVSTADEHAGVPVPGTSGQKITRLTSPAIIQSKWNGDMNDWEKATHGCGLIDDGFNYRLDVWRGSTQIPGYIACIQQKKKVIDEVGQRLRAFLRSGSNNQKSISILFQADPGSGKTFLARSLAKAFGFEFLSFDITQMLHRDELLDIFDMIATRQANLNKPLLVFVDEINGLVDATPVYGAFLSPLEDGIYLRRGNAFSLRPCVWVFAGTKLEEETMRHGEKLSDYKSRMTMIKSIDYESLKNQTQDKVKMENEARLEQVYLGATIIRKMYPDVQWVGYDVLERFHDENPAESPARNIAKKVAALTNVQYGRITRANCSMWENIEWSSNQDNRMVRLIFDEQEYPRSNR